MSDFIEQRILLPPEGFSSRLKDIMNECWMILSNE